MQAEAMTARTIKAAIMGITDGPEVETGHSTKLSGKDGTDLRTKWEKKSKKGKKASKELES